MWRYLFSDLAELAEESVVPLIVLGSIGIVIGGYLSALFFGHWWIPLVGVPSLAFGIWYEVNHRFYVWVRCPACRCMFRFDEDVAVTLPRQRELDRIYCHWCKTTDLAPRLLMHPHVQSFHEGLQEAKRERLEAEQLLKPTAPVVNRDHPENHVE